VGEHDRRGSMTTGINKLENPGLEISSGFAASQPVVHHEHLETVRTYFSPFLKLDKCPNMV
jgi:hypothetical protein